MKEITRKSKSRAVRVPMKMVASTGKKVRVTYACPESKNDLKRWGKEMTIKNDNFSVTLNGKAINSIKKVLVEAGEI